jgi:hypothetical protein
MICSVKICERIAVTNGLCDGHYARARKNGGDPGTTALRTVTVKGRRHGVCSVPDCGKPERARFLCPAHYEAMRSRSDAPVQRRTKKAPGALCSRAHCDALEWTAGLCRRHYQRKHQYGAASLVLPEVCEVCGTTERLTVDHDHACCPGPRSCGKCVRGRLCGACNTALGSLRDDPDRAMALALYAEKHIPKEK